MDGSVRSGQGGADRPAPEYHRAGGWQLSRRDASSPLSRREREIAGLVAQGLTDRDIGGRLFISERTVEGHLQRIRNKLGFDNRTQIASWVTSLSGPGRQAEALAADAGAHDNLPPQLTSFIGRERELSEARRLLQSVRLLTIVGPGGCGKTRLAIQLGGDVLHRHPAGLWFIDLSPVGDPNVVPRAIAAALGIGKREGNDPLDVIASELAGSRRRHRMLLILDSCEHLLDRCAATVDRLLRASPDVVFLCTSREPLHVAGEVVWKLGPLGLPDRAQSRSARGVAESEAGRFFVDRARLSDPEFELSESNAPDVAALCHRLDGIPLALEIAAARVGLMSFEQILEHLDERLGGPGVYGAPGRHETLSATIAWSYELLSEAERALLRRLAVFGGSFTYEAADAVCGEGDRAESSDAFALLTALADKSLVVPIPPLRRRYRCLELIARFAEARLRESGEAMAVRRRHFEYYSDLVARAAGELVGADQSEWLERLADAHDNLRSALEFSRQTGLERRCQLVLGLVRFWHVRGHLGEGRQWTEDVLAAAGAEPTPLRARLLNAAGGLAAHQGDVVHARWRFEEGLAAWRALDDRGGIQTGLSSLGVIAIIRGEWELARALHVECLALARELGDEQAVGLALCNMGLAMIHLDEHEAARAGLDEALEIVTRLGDTVRVAVVLANLGTASIRCGRYDEAAVHYRDSLRIIRALGARQDLAECLEGLAFIDAQAGRTEDALRLAGAAAGIRDAMGAPHTPWTKQLLSQWIDEVRSSLGKSADRLWKEGMDLPEAEAVALALDEVARPGVPARR
jgi:predicted ATPase/DNA-binding CsgD family transcriptional regulator